MAALVELLKKILAVFLRKPEGKPASTPAPPPPVEAVSPPPPLKPTLQVVNIALDIGHRFKTSKPKDQGVVFQGLIEADIVERYIRVAAAQLCDTEMGGLRVKVFTPDVKAGTLVGDYPARQKWANENGIDFYLQGHINAGGGSYALMEYVSLEASLAAAKILGINLASEIKEITKYRVELLTPEKRVYVCLKDLRCPAVLYEPCFVDYPKHYEGLKADWPERIAKTIVQSVQELLRGGVICPLSMKRS